MKTITLVKRQRPGRPVGWRKSDSKELRAVEVIRSQPFLSYAAVADILGCTGETVEQAAKKHGLDRWRKEQFQRFKIATQKKYAADVVPDVILD